MKISTLVFAILIATGISAQGIFWIPSVFDPGTDQVRLYVDISSEDCGCPELLDADPETNPLYVWTWGPNEQRPEVQVGGQLFNTLNGDWNNSNENLKMEVDPDNSNLWYYEFVGAPLADFYGVTPQTLFEEGISFLLKEKNGAPQDEPEQKSIDLYIDMPTEAGGDFSEIELVDVTDEIDSPTVITNAGDERIFVVEQPGVIRIFYRDGTVESQPFLDIQDRVEDAGGEQGLLGLAFPPDYCTDGRFYMNYTHTENTQLVTRISRFEVDPENPNQGDPDSEEILIQFNQDFSNHNGGHLEFGPDGYLYIGTGDGGSGGDPNNRAQDITSYLGKMLRIDVSPESGYDIPLDNPYIFDDFGQDEIWSFGLRNPWKFAFDSETGDLYIADVGQNAFEEVNFESFLAEGGLNYGWRCYEGNADYNLNGCDAPEYVFPVYEYAHSNPSFNHCSVTGGRVYRGPSFELFQGAYFFTDFCSGYYWAIRPSFNGFSVYELGTAGASFVTTFGEDVFGEIYLGNSAQIRMLTDPNDELEDPLVLNGNTLSTTVDGNFFFWFYEGELLSATSQNFLEVEATGTYSVEIETDNGCTITLDTEVTALSDGLGRIESEFTLFPNPTSGIFELRADNLPEEGVNIALFSVEGRLLRILPLGSAGNLIDVSSLPTGIYIVEIQRIDGTRLAMRKLVKNR